MKQKKLQEQGQKNKNEIVNEGDKNFSNERKIIWLSCYAYSGKAQLNWKKITID